MKKFTTLVLAAGLVVSSFAGASAGEFKPNAQFINQFEGANAGSMFEKNGMGQNEHFKASMRLRLGFDYIASETLSGTFLMQMGQYDYGNSNILDGVADVNTPSSFDGYQTDIRVRLAYVDWIIPTTAVQVRMGFQPVALPAFAFGSAVLDTRGTGVNIAAPINDNISVGFNWTRAVSSDSTVDVTRGGDDADIFALTADFDYDGFRIAPWAMYAMAGRNVNVTWSPGLTTNPGYDTNAWYIGTSFELSMFDPFNFALDAYYSSVDWDNNNSVSFDDPDMSGFFVGASASYNTDWGTPALKGWYASGHDAVGTDTLGQPATVIGAFAATSIMFDDQVMDNGMSNYNTGNPAGTAGVILEWADLSFVESLDHTIRVAYIMGTNDYGDGPDASGRAGKLSALGTEDSVIEFNLNSTYEIYKNLSTTLELGYLMADYNVPSSTFFDGEDDAIMRGALSFTYSF